MSQMLTGKEKAFADAYIDNKKTNKVRAAMIAYPNATYGSAAQLAVDNLKKPKIIQYLNDHSEQAGSTLVEIMNDKDKSSQETRRKAAVDVLNFSGNKPAERKISAQYNIDVLVSELE